MNTLSDGTIIYTDHAGQPFIMHTTIHDQEVIPYDSFDVGDNEYAVMKISPSSNGTIYLRIVCIEGPHFGTYYTVPVHEIENHQLHELDQLLQNYAH